MADNAAKSKPIDLIEIINNIVNKNITSPKLKLVEAATKSLDAYVNENKDATNKPDDLARVRAAIAHLKKAEKEFEIKEKDIYGSGLARNAAKKVLAWCGKNSNNAAGVKKACNFADKVKTHDKAPKTTAPKTIKAYAVDNALAALDMIRDILPAGKKEIKDALEAKAQKVVKAGKERLTILGKAVSGVVTDITRAGADDKCEDVTVVNKKYNKKS
jgi:hypothetical protein